MQSILFAVPVVLSGATGAVAQPVSWGMAQSAALIGVMEQHVSTQLHKGYLADAAVIMFDAAVLQARAEGREAVELRAVKAAKQAEWTAMGWSMAFDTEFRDWVDYCKALARPMTLL